MKLFLLAVLAFAQPALPPGESYDEPAEEPAQKQELTLDDARVNFGTVIDSFLAQNTRDGVWNLRDKRTKKIRKLVFDSVDERSVKPASGGPARFRGVAAFKEEGAKQAVRMEFTVDMSGAQWKVVGAKMLRR